MPLIDRVKIQAELLVPLIKELEAELGMAQAHHLVRRAFGDVYRQMAAGWVGKRGSVVAMQTFVEVSYADDAIDAEEREASPTVRAVDVTGCRYAEFVHQLGEPELGLLFVCSADSSLREFPAWNSSGPRRSCKALPSATSLPPLARRTRRTAAHARLVTCSPLRPPACASGDQGRRAVA